jgi:regulator of sirC expression with transglutaminase-like and TPR domain
MTTNPARHRFRAQLERPEGQIDLADAALCIAWEDTGQGDPDTTLAQLDALAAGVRDRLDGLNHPPTIVAVLNSYLFEDLGFRGNTWSYSDPQNSYLDRVIETRAGLPITLSVVYIEVARRLGLPMVGVPLPGHFIVRYVAPEENIFVDPFHRGRRWSYAECETQVRLFYGIASPELMRDVLAPPPPAAILSRILRNLKNIYVERGDFVHALAAVERILIVEGETAHELRDRGLLRIRLGFLALALQDLDAYARMAPDASDLDAIRRHARTLAERFGRNS